MIGETIETQIMFSMGEFISRNKKSPTHVLLGRKEVARLVELPESLMIGAVCRQGDTFRICDLDVIKLPDETALFPCLL